MAKPDAVLCIGAGLLQTYMIPVAHALGLAIVCTDGNPDAQGAALADAFFHVDTYDAVASSQVIPVIEQSYTLRGVVTCGADVAPTVAAAAAVAGTPGLPYAVARRTHRKDQVRQALAQAGLGHYQPRWLLCSSTQISLEDDLAYVGYPCLVKPLSQRASRGVQMIWHPSGLAPAVRQVVAFGDTYLVEECLVGTEHSAEVLFGADGAVRWWNIVDRFFDYTSSVPIETGHVNPSCLPLATQEAIRTMVLQVAAALEVTWGPFKVDVLVEEMTQRPYVLECAARLSGGFDSQCTSPMTGRFPLRQLCQLACRLPVDPPYGPAQGAAACAAILPTGPPHVCRDLPRLTIAESPNAFTVVWTMTPGALVQPVRHNGERPGYVLAHAPTAADAWHQASTAAFLLAQRL